MSLVISVMRFLTVRMIIMATEAMIVSTVRVSFVSSESMVVSMSEGLMRSKVSVATGTLVTFAERPMLTKGFVSSQGGVSSERSMIAKGFVSTESGVSSKITMSCKITVSS